MHVRRAHRAPQARTDNVLSASFIRGVIEQAFAAGKATAMTPEDAAELHDRFKAAPNILQIFDLNRPRATGPFGRAYIFEGKLYLARTELIDSKPTMIHYNCGDAPEALPRAPAG
jgi:hypothetical protein